MQSRLQQLGSYRNTYDLQVTQSTNGDASFTFAFPTYRCTLSGTLVLHGSQYTMPGAEYKCTQGGSTVLSTSADLAEIKATAQGIEGRWTAPGRRRLHRERVLLSRAAVARAARTRTARPLPPRRH